MAEDRMREWLIWKVFGPFMFFLLIWPLYYINNDANMYVSHTFHHAFAPGELLIFSALVFIEMAIEVSYLKKEVRQRFQGWLDVGRLLALLPIFLYGAIVANVIRIGDNEKYHDRLMLYSWFALTFAVLAVATSVYTFWKVKQLELSKRTRRAREPRQGHP